MNGIAPKSPFKGGLLSRCTRAVDAYALMRFDFQIR